MKWTQEEYLTHSVVVRIEKVLDQCLTIISIHQVLALIIIVTQYF